MTSCFPVRRLLAKSHLIITTITKMATLFAPFLLHMDEKKQLFDEQHKENTSEAFDSVVANDHAKIPMNNDKKTSTRNSPHSLAAETRCI